MQVCLTQTPGATSRGPAGGGCGCCCRGSCPGGFSRGLPLPSPCGENSPVHLSAAGGTCYRDPIGPCGSGRGLDATAAIYPFPLLWSHPRKRVDGVTARPDPGPSTRRLVCGGFTSYQ